MSKGSQRDPSLADRYEVEEGDVFLSGTQALIRLMFDQKRRDLRAGLRTGTFISGYPGSPLGGIDTALRSAAPILKKFDVRHLPAQNEELAATSLMGTQMLDSHPHPDCDGVVAFWYGKGPGVDRSGDAMKHGNFAGTSKHGAVVILSGEDHEAKSSTVPYQQEFSFEHFGIPVLYPASVAEFLEFGQHAVAMSRYSGCWVALKLVGSLCDGGQTVHVRPDQPAIRLPDLEIDGAPFAKKTNFTFFPVLNIETERNLYYERHVAVRAYARANGIDRIIVRSNRDLLGIVAAGKSFTDVRQALCDLGFDDAGLSAAGIRLLKMGLLCPLESETVRDFAQGLDEIIVVEEKRDFLERQIGRAVCDLGRPIRIVGKTDEAGRPLFPIQGGMDQDQVARILAGVLAAHGLLPEGGQRRAAEIESIRARPQTRVVKRTPTFCSGCPHNTGTLLAPGQIAWGSPGCHIFAALRSEPEHRIEAVTQYGGEGLPWIGLSPFTSRPHMVQNVGDGSLFHSSYLNIRYAVTAGVSMTYKILYNGAIANTGGQAPVSARSVPQLVTLLATEGVARIAIVTKDRRSYRSASLPTGTIVREPDEMQRTLEDLARVKGVTVLIYDGQCTNERRRQHKRGKLPKPTRFTIINEEVCENCGNCGEVANCMSLQKVDTAFGPKTRIHQSSCNQDMSCLKGECPSFVTVETKFGGGVRKPTLPVIVDPPEPARPVVDRPYHIYIPGLGGTGVLTANAILAQAATLDGSRAVSFDLTGTAQKWGPVLSSLIVTPRDSDLETNNIGTGRADLYLALDLIAAADMQNLRRCLPSRTTAVVNSAVSPTGEMIRNVHLLVSAEPMVEQILSVTDRKRAVVLNAHKIAEALFGDYMMTNMVVIGTAYQAGLLPISAESVERAIRMNEVQVEGNTLAFRAGRVAVHDPARLSAIIRPPFGVMADRVAELGRRPSPRRAAALAGLMARAGSVDAESATLLEMRTADLIDYQSTAYAQRYVDAVAAVAVLERKVLGPQVRPALIRAVIHNLHKLMAYKDEYEVARLLTHRTFLERAEASFEGTARISYNLQPPFLRAFGMKRKVALGPWFRPVLRILAGARALRGTLLDPFGYAQLRRTERELITWYLDVVEQAMSTLTAGNRELVEALLGLPVDIRGYEEIKLRSIVSARAKAAELLAQLKTGEGVNAVTESKPTCKVV